VNLDISIYFEGAAVCAESARSARAHAECMVCAGFHSGRLPSSADRRAQGEGGRAAFGKKLELIITNPLRL